MVAKINYCKRTAMLDGKDNMGKREGRKEGRKVSLGGRNWKDNSTAGDVEHVVG